MGLVKSWNAKSLGKGHGMKKAWEEETTNYTQPSISMGSICNLGRPWLKIKNGLEYSLTVEHPYVQYLIPQ